MHTAEKQHSTPKMLGEGVLEPVCMTATLPQDLVMLHPILSLGLLVPCFYIFILRMNMRHRVQTKKTNSCFISLVTIFIYFCQL